MKKRRQRQRRRMDLERQLSKEMLNQVRMENVITYEAYRLEQNRVKRKEMESYVR
ncbi:hypothetical protein KEJ45_03420 [Candidatus Bathyarchaeota archaeon]|nr:hypothetical protein [Candidatus Bathyarchaeota archaeon]